MSVRARILPHYTVQDYVHWEGRWEIIEGSAVAMSPMLSPRHQELANKLGRILSEAVESTSCKDCKVYQPLDVKIEEDTLVQPDLLIICQPIPGQFVDFPPAMVVEILSPSTRLKDLHVKYGLYEDFGIRHYLIIDPDHETIQLYRLDKDGKYVESNHNAEIIISPDCTVNLELAQLFN